MKVIVVGAGDREELEFFPRLTEEPLREARDEGVINFRGQKQRDVFIQCGCGRRIALDQQSGCAFVQGVGDELRAVGLRPAARDEQRAGLHKP